MRQATDTAASRETTVVHDDDNLQQLQLQISCLSNSGLARKLSSSRLHTTHTTQP